MTTSTIQEAFDDAMRYIDSLLDIAKKHNERFAALEKRVKEQEKTIKNLTNLVHNLQLDVKDLKCSLNDVG